MATKDPTDVIFTGKAKSPMEYNFISDNCGLQVSSICLGTMTFGKGLEVRNSRQTTILCITCVGLHKLCEPAKQPTYTGCFKIKSNDILRKKSVNIYNIIIKTDMYILGTYLILLIVQRYPYPYISRTHLVAMPAKCSKFMILTVLLEFGCVKLSIFTFRKFM